MNESEIPNVHDLKYVKKVRFTLNSIGAWPNKELGATERFSKNVTIYNYFMLFVCSTAMVSEVLYLRKYNGLLEFTELGHTYVTIFMGCLFVQRITMPMQKKYCDVTKDFFTKFHLIHHRSGSDYAAKMNTRIHKICYIFTMLSTYQMLFGVVLYSLTPLINNYRAGMFNEVRPANVTFEQAIYYVLPFDQYNNLYYYIITFIFNVFLSYTVVCAFCGFDLLLCLIVFHIWGHLNILKYRLAQFPQPKRGHSENSIPWFTDDEAEEVQKELISLINYHRMITQFMDKISKAYSVFLYVYFTFHQVSGCVLLLECSQLDAEALAKYLPLTFVQFQQLIQLSIIFELINTKGESIIIDVYELPWECMSSKNAKTVAFFLLNVQKPLAIKAGDMVPVGVQTMFSIIKASISYFIMLTAFAQEEDDVINVSELQYLKKLRSTFDSVGLWPNKHLGHNDLRSNLLYIYKFILVVLCTLCVISQCLYVYKYKNILGFDSLGNNYITILMSTVFVQRLVLSATDTYCNVVKEFVLKFHLIHHRNMSNVSFEIYKRVNKICYIVTLLSYYQMYLGAIMYNAVPVFNNYKTGMFSSEKPVNGTFEHSLYFVLPFDQYTNISYYVIIVLFNCYISYNVSCVFCTFDLLIFMKVFHIWGHFNILLHNLNNFRLPKCGNPSNYRNQGLRFSNEENQDVYIDLKKVIEHHKIIKGFVKRTSESYSFAMCVYYAFHQVTGCVLLLECSKLDPEALGKYGPLTVILFQQLIQVSVVFELIKSKNEWWRSLSGDDLGETLADAVYGLPWEYMDRNNRRTVMLFLLNVQKPLSLKAGDVVSVGVQTMAQIIKTTWSCYLMLKTLSKD